MRDLLSIVCLLCFASPSGLLAQGARNDASAGQSRRDRARQAFQEGEQAYYAGRFREALDRFSLAYELSARAELLYNIGTAHDRLNNAEPALRSYREYLEARPEAPNREFVLARIAVLEGVVAGDASAGSAQGESGNPGSGSEVGPRSVEDGAERDGSRVEAGDAERGSAGTAVESDAPRETFTASAAASEDSPGPSVAGIVLLGTAGAAGVAAAVTGVMALGQRSDLDEQCSAGVCDPALEGDLDRLGRLTTATDVLIGVAAVAATAGVVLFVTSGGDDEEAGLSAGCGLARCEATLRW